MQISTKSHKEAEEKEKGIMAVIFIALIIVNWIIYHKLFKVVYFNLGAGLLREFLFCLFFAGIEIALFSAIGGAILPFIFTILFIIGGAIGIYELVKLFRDAAGLFKKSSKETPKDTHTSTEKTEQTTENETTK